MLALRTAPAAAAASGRASLPIPRPARRHILLSGRPPSRSGASRPTAASSSSASASSALSKDESELLSLLRGGSGSGSSSSSGSSSGGRISVGRAEAVRVESLVAALEAAQPGLPSNASPLLPGAYRLLRTFKPGEAAADFFSIASWQEYLKGGPSPVQSLLISKVIRKGP